MLTPEWITIWAITGYMNPLAFAFLWTGVEMLMWSAASNYPGGYC